MIPVSAGVRVWLATGHTDMRRGFPSLALLVQEQLKQDPYSGHLFIFRGRRGDLVKIIWHDSFGRRRRKARSRSRRHNSVTCWKGLIGAHRNKHGDLKLPGNAISCRRHGTCGADDSSSDLLSQRQPARVRSSYSRAYGFRSLGAPGRRRRAEGDADRSQQARSTCGEARARSRRRDREPQAHHCQAAARTIRAII
jgi:transposase